MKVHFPYRSVATQLVSTIIPLTILGIAITGFVAYTAFRPHVIETTKKSIVIATEEVARQTSSFFQQKKNELQLISQTPLFEDYFINIEFGLSQEAAAYRQQIERYLFDFFTYFKSTLGVWYLGKNGEVIVGFQRIASDSPIRKSSAPWFLKSHIHQKKVSSKKVYESQLIKDSLLGEIVLNTIPLIDELGEPTGQLVAASGIDSVTQAIKNLIAGHKKNVFLSDKEEIPVFYWEKQLSELPSSRDSLYSLQIPLLETPWALNIQYELQGFLKPLYRFQLLVSLLSFLAALGVSLIIYFRIDRLINPIRLLRNATEKMATGQLSQQVNIECNNEIGALSETFNHMAKSLRERTEDLEDRVHELKELAEQKASLLEEMERSKLRYQTTLDSSLDGIIGLDSRFCINTWNRGAQALFGYSENEAVGRSLNLFLSPTTVENLLRLVQTKGSVVNFDTEGISKRGEIVNLNFTLASGANTKLSDREWTMVIRNVTEQKALQSQLIQSEKLAVVGQLVAGVAHEINNPLTAVIGYSELVTGENDLSSQQAKEDLSYIRENAVRCRDIVGNLLRFVRKEPIKKKKVNLNEVLHNVLQLMSYRLTKKESVQVEWREEPRLPFVSGDLHQLEQVFLNLIHNACDALRCVKKQKKISISFHQDQDQLNICVSDNGVGIPPDVAGKIFEPFFTTKEIGKGTGLGLAICQRIIKDHGGRIDVQSKVGMGASFIVSLPTIKTFDEKEPDLETNFPSVTGKTILVVEDEPDLIPLMKHALINEGNNVISLGSGHEARLLLQNHEVDLVISDIGLGDISGFDLCEYSRSKKISTPFLFTTGDLIDQDLIDKVKSFNSALLPKPFSVTDLTESVKKIFRKHPTESKDLTKIAEMTALLKV